MKYALDRTKNKRTDYCPSVCSCLSTDWLSKDYVRNSLPVFAKFCLRFELWSFRSLLFVSKPKVDMLIYKCGDSNFGSFQALVITHSPTYQHKILYTVTLYGRILIKGHTDAKKICTGVKIVAKQSMTDRRMWSHFRDACECGH